MSMGSSHKPAYHSRYHPLLLAGNLVLHAIHLSISWKRVDAQHGTVGRPCEVSTDCGTGIIKYLLVALLVSGLIT